MKFFHNFFKISRSLTLSLFQSSPKFNLTLWPHQLSPFSLIPQSKKAKLPLFSNYCLQLLSQHTYRRFFLIEEVANSMYYIMEQLVPQLIYFSSTYNSYQLRNTATECRFALLTFKHRYILCFYKLFSSLVYTFQCCNLSYVEGEKNRKL